MKQYILLVIAALFMASCEKEIKVDVPPHEPRLVINSSTMQGETMKVSVGKSVGVVEYNNRKSQIIPDATVIVTVDGVSHTLQYDEMQQTYMSDITVTQGKTYQLKVRVKGFPDAEATAVMPEIVTLSSIRVVPQVRNTNDYGLQDELTLEFTDPATVGDYYMLNINTFPYMGNPDSAGYYGYYNYSSCVTSPDPSIEENFGDPFSEQDCLSSNAIYFNDQLFNGGRKELKLYVQTGMLDGYSTSPNGDTIHPRIELYHLTEGYYKYLKATKYALDNEGNPFAEPISIYTNIKNGYGIFSVVSASYKNVR
jgi:Domain of unknown function (DUF4249)